MHAPALHLIIRHPLTWVLLSLLSIVVDYISGPLIQFPIVFLVPVAIASWYNGKFWGLFLSLSLPLVRMAFTFYWTVPWTIWETSGNTLIRMIVFSLFAILIKRVTLEHQRLKQEVKTLEGLLPICCVCKKIRNGNGNWEQMEKYISDRSEAQFSHGLCPECAKKEYPEYTTEL